MCRIKLAPSVRSVHLHVGSVYLDPIHRVAVWANWKAPGTTSEWIIKESRMKTNTSQETNLKCWVCIGSVSICLYNFTFCLYFLKPQWLPCCCCVLTVVAFYTSCTVIMGPYFQAWGPYKFSGRRKITRIRLHWLVELVNRVGTVPRVSCDALWSQYVR